MSVESENVPPVAPPSVVVWPLPPFFRLAPGSAGKKEDCACSVEMADGSVIKGHLLAFEAHAPSALIATGPAGAKQSIALKDVQLIRLTAPVRLEEDKALMQAVGVAHIADAHTLHVELKGGGALTGTSRGFVKDAAGLFVYFTEPGGSTVSRCFIPAAQVQHARIGKPLGEALVDAGSVSPQAVSEALERQVKWRQEKLGKLLLDRGIVSPDELRKALQSQKRLPAARLGQLLIDAGLITQDQLDEAVRIQASNRKRRMGDILVDMGAVTLRLVQVALSDKLGIPLINVREFRVDPVALELLGADIAMRYQVLPLVCAGRTLVVAMANPLADDALQELRFLVQRSIIPVMANPDDLQVRIAKEYSSLRAADGDHASDGSHGRDLAHSSVEDLTLELSSDRAGAANSRAADIESPRVSDNALVRLVNKIIIDAHAAGASDIHIECNAGNGSTKVRFRRDGDLEEYLDLQHAYGAALISRLKIMADLDIAERRHAQDGKINFAHFGPLTIELRVAIIPTVEGREDAVLRILGGVEPLPLEELGLHGRDLAKLKRMALRSYGLILVCGPTGSGKTTTLHSILHFLNRPDIKIWTAEDPVEITQPGLRQVQINSRIDWTFAAAMRSFLRADPDVIMVGEMRDAETTKIGIEASLTGHLVFSTLHTNSAAESVVRLLDLGMDPFNFADAIIGVLSQRLARRLCLKCRRGHTATIAEINELLDEYGEGFDLDRVAVLEAWRQEFSAGGEFVIYEPQGCGYCHGGYKGRLGVYELLAGTDEAKQVIRARGTVPQLLKAGRADGMRLLRHDAIEKVLLGLLDRASARQVST